MLNKNDMQINLELRFDGGCKPTNPGERYGSYLLLKDGREIAREDQFQLGHGTNNEAEWMACLAGLDRVVAGGIRKGWNLKDIALKIFTDSTIVSMRLQKEPAAHRPKPGPSCRMWVLSSHAFRRLNLLGSFTAAWRGRDGNVLDFGH